MPRTPGLVLAFALCLAAAPAAASQGTLDAIHVVTRFTEALNAGDLGNATAALGAGVTWSEHDLHPRVAATQREARQRVIELVSGGVRLETEPVAVVGSGNMVIAHERMWGDFVPEELAPLRSTTVYLVAGGRLVGITRMLAGDQRDALAAATIVGTWRSGANHIRFVTDGAYRIFNSTRDLHAEQHADSGTATVAGGVVVLESDDGSLNCDPGELTPVLLHMIDDDTVHFTPLRDQITCALHRTLDAVTYRRLEED